MEKSSKIDMKTPTISLNEEALHWLKKIFTYTKILQVLLTEIDSKELKVNLQKDPTLQHAIIFLLKAIGICIDNAAKKQKLKSEDMPLFWENIYYLRNGLIHHLKDAVIRNENGLDLLANICKNSGQIYKYFSLIVEKKNTNIDLGGQRFKVFLDVHALTHSLKSTFPKEERNKISQVYYLNVLETATKGIKVLTEKLDLSEDGMDKLEQENPKVYYALQDILELIATIANPSPEFRLLTQSTRDKINKSHSDADSWLRDLGESRKIAMHQVIIISNDKFYSHIKDILALRKEVFLNDKFREVVGLKSYANLKNSSLQKKPSTTQPNIIAAAPKSNAKVSNSTNIFFAAGRGQGNAHPEQQSIGTNIPQSGQPLSGAESSEDDTHSKNKTSTFSWGRGKK